MSFGSQCRRKALKGQRANGQIIVEYVLLLVVAVSIALLITSTLVSRNPDNPGFLISRWDKIIRFIGLDQADEPNAPKR